MGIRFRRSKKVLHGVRLNINKNSVGLTFGVKGLRYTINSKGRKTATVGIPGTGLSYSTSSNQKTPEKPQAEELAATQSFTPICEISKRSSVGPSILTGILGLWAFAVALSEPHFGNVLLFAILVSAVSIMLLVRDNVKSAKRVAEVHPEIAEGPLDSLAAESAVLLSYGGKTWRVVSVVVCLICALAFACSAVAAKKAGYIAFCVVMLIYAGLTMHGLLKISRSKRSAMENIDQPE